MLLPLFSDPYMHYTVSRRILWTGGHPQLVLMTVPPRGKLDEEVCQRDIARKGPVLTAPRRFTLWTSILFSRPAPRDEKEVTPGDLAIVLVCIYRG
jgi:hypothetical protein